MLAEGYPAFTLEDFHDTVSMIVILVECFNFYGSTSIINFVLLYAQFIDTLESTSNPETTVESLTKVNGMIGQSFASFVLVKKEFYVLMYFYIILLALSFGIIYYIAEILKFLCPYLYSQA